MAEGNSNPQPAEYYSQGLRRQYQLDGLALNPPSVDKSEKYADIEYKIDETKYHERTKSILEAGGLPTTVPGGFPQKLQGPLVWDAADFADEQQYVLQLSKDDVDEIVKALAHFKEQGLEGEEVGQDSFPLPGLRGRLEQAADDIYAGRGFVIVRGLDPELFSPEDHTVAYLGISSYIAKRRGKQDQRGTMLMHVVARDDKEEGATNPDKPFHNDTVCDTLALVTRDCAASGGNSVLASAWTVYNELAATRPDILHVLAAPDWPFDTFGRKPAFYKRACLFWYDEKLILNFSRRLLVGYAPVQPRTPGIPGLTERQAEALDAVHFIAEKHAIKTPMEKGDIRFINNMAILHRREAFVNDSTNERHLVRIWLNNPEKCWKLPPPLQLAWARVFDDPDRAEQWDLNPQKVNQKIFRARSCD